MTAAEARRALALAERAFRELLTCVELSDLDNEGQPIPGASTVRWLGGCAEDRYQAAKAKAHQVLDEITTLQRGAR